MIVHIQDLDNRYIQLAVDTPLFALYVKDYLQTAAPAFCFFDKSRRTGEHNDYTKYHLPVRNERPDCPKNEDAILASFAARIAFSNFIIRSWDKYGVSAFNSVR